ncbi:alanine--tRNA ligase-related protein [Actinobacillus pleuropneumoniae]|uniref:alanine--tRNA ligase-related protein n=1 Tax=Actinobacillus pleuropneumoniae TaxID=715 RepID=UPI003F7B7C2D
MPKKKLYVTVYETDDEAYDIWNKIVGVPTDHIIRIGDNKKVHRMLRITSGQW